MKTRRITRIMMMALDYIALFILRIFRPFAKTKTYAHTMQAKAPMAVEATQPNAHGIKAELEVDGQVAASYRRVNPISVSPDEPYGDYEGILTFGGNQLRDGGAYGTAAVKEKKLRLKWSMATGRLEKGYGKGYWTGSGWTGQPLLVRWTKEQKQPMVNILPEKKETDFVEAIYSTMDGNVYFIDIADGTNSRETLQVGLPFKGAGALHPSLPILHLGPGDSGPREDLYARAYLYSLTDGEKLLEYGGRDLFALREFHGYDSAPLFYNDYIIEPSENGILYSFKLNAALHENGTVSINVAEQVKLRYTTARSGDEAYWLGMEDSAVLYENYLYIADNGGTLLCVDVNTMQIIWAQDVVDDTNGSPVLSIEEGIPYLYIGTSLHWSASKWLKLGDVPFFKINALTGEYVWIRSYFCCTIAGISGGVQATPVVGKNDIENLVIVPFARTPSVRNGILVALDKKTGQEVWRYKLPGYAWSSPVAVYDEEGKSYIVQGDSTGLLHLIDGATGRRLHTINLESNIEATPAIFDNMLVVGTRGMRIYGVEIS